MKVLLAIDYSTFSQAAMNAVIRQMQPDQTEVCVLHVVEPLSHLALAYRGQAINIKAARRDALKEGKQLVRRVKQLLSKAGFKVQEAVEEGDPRSAIIDHAARWTTDLIVVGSHGRKGLKRFLLGSVAEYVARYARCSVLIVRMSSTR